MPIDPNTLPWWGWLAVALVSYAVSWMASAQLEANGKGSALIIGFSAWAISILAALTGLVLFARLIWNS